MSSSQPISYLPGAEAYIQSHLDNFQDSLSLFRIALGKPHALDDGTLQRSLAHYGQMLVDAEVPERQLSLWRNVKLTASQRAKVAKLEELMGLWRERCQAIIDLIGELLRQNASPPEPGSLAVAAFFLESHCRPYASLTPTSRSDLPFVLPPEVTVTRRNEREKLVYAFEHIKLGLLGELLVSPAPSGALVDVWVNDQEREGSARRRTFLALTGDLLTLCQGMPGAFRIRGGEP